MDSNSVIIVSETADILTTIVTQVAVALVTGSLVLLAGYIAYRYGLKAYFKRREHEQIIKRYLDEGVDRVLAGVDQALRVFIDNYLIADTIVTKLINNKEADLLYEAQRFDRNHLELASYRKISYLVGDEIFWSVIQLLFGFIDAESYFLNTKFKTNLKKIAAKQTPEGEILKTMKMHLDMSYRKFEEYSSLIQELRQITVSLEKQTTLNWSNLARFKERSDIKASVKRMKETFGPEIQKRRREQKQ